MAVSSIVGDSGVILGQNKNKIGTKLEKSEIFKYLLVGMFGHPEPACTGQTRFLKYRYVLFDAYLAQFEPK